VIVLYGPSQAPFTEKVSRALALKGLPFEIREPETPEDYRRWNPETGLLPLLDIDGERVHDSTRILLRLDELYPDPPLLSPEPRTRAAQRNLEHWVDESFVFYWLRWQRLLEQRDEAPPPPSPRGVRGWLRSRGAKERNDRPSEGRRIGQAIGERLVDLDRMLAERPFFYSSRISMADLAVYAMLRSLASDSIPGGAAQLGSRPRLVAFMQRVDEATSPKLGA
jgi:glutathione S-transferase